MLNDIPYSELRKDKRAYDIMLLRDQYGNSLSAIAEVYGISTASIRQIYHRIKMKQIFLYIPHIAMALGHRDTSQILKIYHSACEYYQRLVYVSAYLEKEYADILTEYRDGEPGCPRHLSKNFLHSGKK